MIMRRFRSILPLVLEVAGSLSVVIAVGALVGPWLAMGFGGILLIGAGVLMQSDQ